MIRLRRPGRRTALAALPALGAAAGLLVAFAEYGHREITRSLRSEFRDDPARWGLDAAEEVWLEARDRVRIHAWFFESPGTTTTVIVCHGHGANKHAVLPIAGFLRPRFNVLLLDSRGHGESGGRRTTIGYEERLDVYAAADELTRRGLGPIGIVGISMGASIAIMAAAEDERIAAVVADSPFARLRWAVAAFCRNRGYPRSVAPLAAYVGCRATAIRLGYPMTAFDPVEVVERIAPRPLLLIHGEKDALIDPVNSRRVFERAREPKELWGIEGLDHCQALECAFDAYRDRILKFFDRSLDR